MLLNSKKGINRAWQTVIRLGVLKRRGTALGRHALNLKTRTVAWTFKPVSYEVGV